MKLINPYTMHKTTAIIQAEQDRRKKDEEKMLIAEFGNDMMNMISSANTPKELKKTFTEKTKYWAERGLPNQIQAFWFGKVMDAQKSMLDQQAAQEQRDQRNTLFQQQQDDRAQAKSDERLLGQLQNSKAFAGGETYPQGVEGVYSVPADKQSLLGGLSYQGRNRYDADQNAKQDRINAEQDRALKNRLVQAQINKANRTGVKPPKPISPTDEMKVMEYLTNQAYQSAGYTQDPMSGGWQKDGKPMPQDMSAKLSQAVQNRMPMVTQLISKNGMGVQESVDHVKKYEWLLLQKKVKDSTEEALKSPNLPAYLRRLESQNPDIAAKVKENLMRIKQEEARQKEKQNLFGSYGDLLNSANQQMQTSDGYSKPISTLR